MEITRLCSLLHLGLALLLLPAKVQSYPTSYTNNVGSPTNSGCSTSGSTIKQQPNILLIMLDDLGWNDVGYHNSPDILTPHIDQLASEGVKLENYYVQPICTPSRAALRSGLLDIHLGLQHDVLHSVQRNGLPLYVPTMAEKLRAVGYATHFIGKWHLGHYMYDYTPIHRGYDSNLGIYQGLGNHYNYSACEYFPLPPNPNVQSYYFCGRDLRYGDAPYFVNGIHSTELFAKRAISIMSQHVALSPSKPLFIELAFTAPHYPLQAPDSYIAKYNNTITDPNRKLYAAMVTHIDDAIKNVTVALKTAGLYDNTLIIFTTDNGGENHWGGNSYPYRGNKQTMWDGAMRGVAFVHSPLLGLNGNGRISRDWLHITDWYPTLVKLAGGDVSGQQLDGFDVWNVINNGWQSPRTELLHNIDPLVPSVGTMLPNSPFDNRVMAALRVGKWKLITGNAGEGHWFVSPTQVPNQPVQKQQGGFDFITGFVQRQPGYILTSSPDPATKNLWLFNIDADPTETTDLSNSLPDVVNMMLARLAYYNTTVIPVRFPPQDPAGDPSQFGGYWTPWVESTTV